MAPSLSASGILVGFSTVAISNCTLLLSIGVMTMKIMSSTSMTSTIGVTLMLELTLAASLRTATPIAGLHLLNFLNRTEYRFGWASGNHEKLAAGKGDDPLPAPKYS